MTGDLLMKCLLVAYCVIALAYAWEQNWWKVLYWCSAMGITTAVLGMK